MSSESLIAKIKDDEWFLSLIESRLKENKEPMDETERFMNEVALISSIDFRLKYLNSMTSDSKKEMILKILKVCEENGFIPQYESSGSPSFLSSRVELSPDGIFTACLSNDEVVIFPSRELPLCWTKLTSGKKIEGGETLVDVYFSPDSSKIALLCNGLHIWDLLELRFQRLECVNFLTTVNTISWSTDSKRISYVKQEGEICVYDIPEKRIVRSISISHPISATCLNNQGMNILLLGDSTIRIVDISSGNEINKISSPVSLDGAEALFKDEEFYVLTDGTILKIKDEAEIINLDCVVSPFSLKYEKLYHSKMFDSKFCLSSYGLELKNENIIVHDKSDYNQVDYILSDTLDIQIIQHPGPNFGLSADNAEISEFLDKAAKKYISYESTKNMDKTGQTVYLVKNGQIIGFEKVAENDRYIKYNFRKYIFSKPLGNLLDYTIIPSEFMKSYEKISSDNLNGEFQDDLQIIHHLSPSVGKKEYIRQTGAEVLMNDSSMFKLINFSALSYYRGKLQKKVIAENKNVYICDDNNISSRIYLSALPAAERLLLSEEGIEIKTLPSRVKVIESDDPLNDYYLDEKNALYCMDTFANCKMIADEKTFQHRLLNEIKWISGSTWPKVYVIGKNKESFIQSAPMQNLIPLEEIQLSCPQNICFFSGKVYWVSNGGDICVSDPDGSNIRRRKILNLGGWKSSGKTADGRFSLVKFEMSDDQKINVKFARLFPESGHVDIFENAVFDFRSEEAWRTDLDVKNTFIIIREWGMMYSLTIKKDDLKKGKIIVPSVDPIFSQMTPLADGRYIISTTEDIKNHIDLQYQPQLRAMDSNKGLKIKYNLHQSEGQMYGLSGFQIDSTSKACSLDDGKFMVSEMLPSGQTLSDRGYGLFSWDISSGKRYPAGNDPIYGRLLEKYNEDGILVSLASGGIVHSVVTFNKKMKKISEEKTIFKWRQLSIDSESIELDSDVLLNTFPCISEFVGDDCLEYVEIVKNVIPSFRSFKNGTVVILPISVNSKSESVPPLPHIIVFDRIFDWYSGRHFHNQPPSLVWMNIRLIVCTYSYGRLIHPIVCDLGIVSRNEPDCKHLPCGTLHHLSLHRIGDTYVIQQPVRRNLSDVSEDMRYRTRIIGDGIDFEIGDVMGWQTQGSEEEKLFSLFINDESFSYVIARENEIFFVTNKDGKEVSKKICNEGEYHPVALYADESVSISFDPYYNLMFFSKDETRVVPIGNLLDNTYKYGKFDLISKSEDGTMYFDIGAGEEIKITQDMKIQKSEKKQTHEALNNLGNTICELDDGRVLNYNGVFVKYLN